MNTYAKFAPNVFLAKCTERHNKGERILVTTQHGKENECIVFNLILQRDGHFYYSIVRADGFDSSEYAKRRAAKMLAASSNAEVKSDAYWQKSNKDRGFLVLGEPIKVGHHSEKRHRKAIEDAWNNMGKSVEFSDKAKEYEEKAKYWESRAKDINLSMPDCLEYYEFKLEEARERHEGLKNGSIERDHSFSLTYAKKELNEAAKKVELAKRLWS